MYDRELSTLTIACHVRAPMLLEPVDAHVATLTQCESDGIIDALVLRSWPDAVDLSSEQHHRAVVERFEEFDAWASTHGVSIQPPFEIREHTSMVTSKTKEQLITPLICLGVYDAAGRLTGVYPHSADGETYTVEEAIAAIRTETYPTPLTATPQTGGNRCPECDGRLVNGQGLFECTDCAWTGTNVGDGRYESLPSDDPDAKPPKQ